MKNDLKQKADRTFKSRKNVNTYSSKPAASSQDTKKNNPKKEVK